MSGAGSGVWTGAEAFEKPNLRPTKSGRKHGALKAAKGAKKAAFIAKEVEGDSPKSLHNEDDVLGVVSPGTLYSLNKKGRWRAGEVLTERLGGLQEGDLEVSALEMESPAPGLTGATGLGRKDRLKVHHSMRASDDRGPAPPVAEGEFWDAGLTAKQSKSPPPLQLDAPANRAHLRYHIFHPTASEKARAKEVRKVVKEAGEVWGVRGGRRGKAAMARTGEAREGNPLDSETFGEGTRGTQTETSVEERRRTLSLGDFLPDDLRAGLDEDFALPPDEEDDDWEVLDTPDLDSLDFDKAAAK